jgi:ribosomal protein L37E
MTGDPRDIHCRVCGARKGLKGERDGDVIHITCGSCGNEWDRHPDTCAACGERALVSIRVPLLQKARGTQQSIIGYGIAQRCTSCGAETSNAAAADDLNASA